MQNLWKKILGIYIILYYSMIHIQKLKQQVLLPQFWKRQHELKESVHQVIHYQCTYQKNKSTSLPMQVCHYYKMSEEEKGDKIWSFMNPLF